MQRPAAGAPGVGVAARSLVGSIAQAGERGYWQRVGLGLVCGLVWGWGRGGWVILSFNRRDFLALADRHPRHGGIVLAAQRSWSLAALVAALDRLLSATDGAG